ncbi:MAG: hypothetical protein RMJ88_14225 [Thermogemmata sp.]|nr:hypothetical protein [Thermogemmata sp.]
MNDMLTLDKGVLLSNRFTRSVCLVRDVHRQDAIDDYILTPIGRDVLRRIANALRGDSSTRAWSLTGPYGSGKSAFALFVTQLLAGEESIRLRAREYLASQDSELAVLLHGSSGPLAEERTRFCPVLVSGSRQPLEKALATSLATSLRAVTKRGRPPQLIERLEGLATQETPSSTALVGYFEEANEYLRRFGPNAAGILLIIDELGKFLEYGASNPARSDIFVLQELAELAARSERPFLVFTILHQSIDRYIDHLSPGRRVEWAKIQGRFEDVAFEDRSEQMLRLLARAIQHRGDSTFIKSLKQRAKALAQEVIALGIRVGTMPPTELHECLTACYPLCPLTDLYSR